MTLIADALGEQIVADATCLANVNHRVYRSLVPAGTTLPAISYQLISDTHDPMHTGRRHARVQVNVVAADPASANTVAEAVISAIGIGRLNRAGNIEAWTAGGTTYTILECYPSSSLIIDNPDTGDVVTPIDFLIHYRT